MHATTGHGRLPRPSNPWRLHAGLDRQASRGRHLGEDTTVARTLPEDSVALTSPMSRPCLPLIREASPAVCSTSVTALPHSHRHVGYAPMHPRAHRAVATTIPPVCATWRGACDRGLETCGPPASRRGRVARTNPRDLSRGRRHWACVLMSTPSDVVMCGRLWRGDVIQPCSSPFLPRSNGKQGASSPYFSGTGHLRPVSCSPRRMVPWLGPCAQKNCRTRLVKRVAVHALGGSWKLLGLSVGYIRGASQDPVFCNTRNPLQASARLRERRLAVVECFNTPLPLCMDSPPEQKGGGEDPPGRHVARGRQLTEGCGEFARAQTLTGPC
jgi:hypothetical protein